MVGKYDGSLKAEHGTGRNIAPSSSGNGVQSSLRLMWKLKRLADPPTFFRQGSCSPRIRKATSRTCRRRLRSRRPSIAASSAGSASQSVRAAISRRRRDSELRCAGRWRDNPKPHLAGGDSGGLRLRRDTDLRGRRVCEIACPWTSIPGCLIKHLRHLEHGPRAEAVAAALRANSSQWSASRGSPSARPMQGQNVVGDRTVTAGRLTPPARVVSKDLIPDWCPTCHLRPRPSLPATRRDGAAAVYFTACVNRSSAAAWA